MSTVQRTPLERAAYRAWWEWAVYAKNTMCSRCRRHVYCAARRPRGPWLCVDCFDQEPGR